MIKIAALPLLLHPTRRHHCIAAAMYLPASEVGTVLEIGCGDGRNLTFLRELGWRVSGVEFDTAAVSKATSKGLAVAQGDLCSQNLPSETFDVVYMRHVVEHLPNARETLIEALRITKPGGHLVLVTPNAESWGHGQFGQDWFALEPPRHLWLATLSSLRTLIEETGWKDEKSFTTPLGGYVLALSRRLRLARRNGTSLKTSSTLIALEMEFLDLFAWLLWRFRPGAGEELVMIGKRPK